MSQDYLRATPPERAPDDTAAASDRRAAEASARFARLLDGKRATAREAEPVTPHAAAPERRRERGATNAGGKADLAAANPRTGHAGDAPPPRDARPAPHPNLSGKADTGRDAASPPAPSRPGVLREAAADPLTNRAVAPRARDPETLPARSWGARASAAEPARAAPDRITQAPLEDASADATSAPRADGETARDPAAMANAPLPPLPAAAPPPLIAHGVPLPTRRSSASAQGGRRGTALTPAPGTSSGAAGLLDGLVHVVAAHSDAMAAGPPPVPARTAHPADPTDTPDVMAGAQGEPAGPRELSIQLDPTLLPQTLLTITVSDADLSLRFASPLASSRALLSVHTDELASRLTKRTHRLVRIDVTA